MAPEAHRSATSWWVLYCRESLPGLPGDFLVLRDSSVALANLFGISHIDVDVIAVVEIWDLPAVEVIFTHALLNHAVH